MRMEEGPAFAKRFQQSGRMGFYFRVLEEGEIGAGDTIELTDRDEASATMAEFIEVYTGDARDPESLRRVLASRGLGDSWRSYLEKKLERALRTGDPPRDQRDSD